MDKIEKSLKRLRPEERIQVRRIIQKLGTSQLYGLDIKKLKGREDVYRARKGDIRIIYRIHKGGIFILAIERRSERTYKP